MATQASAIVLSRHGGPETLEFVAVDVAEPGADEVLLRHTAIGVNFHDCYVRSGAYRTLDLPGIPGLEAVGVVEALGRDVGHLKVGDRVGWISPTYGGYCSRRVIPADLAFPLPDWLPDAEAAASVMRACTVSVLVSRSYALGPGERVLVHAAAGGVGQLVTRWARHIGADVIAAVGDERKIAAARRAGAQDVLLYRDEDFVAQVLDLTNQAGVDVVYDSVGAETYRDSLACLRIGGALVSYGQSSGPIVDVSISDLAQKSLTLCRPIVFHYLRTKDQTRALTQKAFSAFKEGVLDPVTPLQLPLADAGRAHAILEARSSPGGVVLIP